MARGEKAGRILKRFVFSSKEKDPILELRAVSEWKGAGRWQ